MMQVELMFSSLIRPHRILIGIIFFLATALFAFAEPRLMPSDAQYVAECDLIIIGKIVSVDKMLLFQSSDIAAKLDVYPMEFIKGMPISSHVLKKYFTVYKYVGGCIIGGKYTSESRKLAREKYKKGDIGLFFLKKYNGPAKTFYDSFYLYFDDYGFKPATKENIEWVKNLLDKNESRMTSSQVKEIADTYARHEGLKLEEYQEPTVEYNAVNQQWVVFYDQIPSDYVDPATGQVVKMEVVGKHFSVVIDDKSGKARLVRGL